MWSPQVESRIKRQAAKGVDILIVDTSPEAVSETGLICKRLGYKPRVLQQSKTKAEWYQWWYLPKKRKQREMESQIDRELDATPMRYSARREGLIPMKGSQ